MMESVRRSARRILGTGSYAYRAAALAADNASILSKEGIRTWQALKRLQRPGPEVRVHLKSVNHALFMRPLTKDLPSVVNNCIREEYGRLPRGFEPRHVVDAGAYIGDTAAYFLSRFSTCSVAAIEADDESYELCHRNLTPYGSRARLVKAALWDSIGTVAFGGSQTGSRVGGGARQVSTTTMTSLMSQLGWGFVDILKMDIEGAETVVLRSGDRSWLQAVGVLLLETHGPGIEAEIFPILKANGFERRQFRNVHYCYNTAALAANRSL